MNTGDAALDYQEHITNQVDRDAEIVAENEAFDLWYAEECERIDNKLKLNQ